MSSVNAVSNSGGKVRWAEGKVALVTGATLGIGLSIAERLGHSGAHIFLCSRSVANVDAALLSLRAKGINASGMPVHVGNGEAREKMVKAALEITGKIDILVSNVAVNPVYGDMLAVTDEKSWDKVFDINVKSHFFLIRSCAPHMPRGSSVLIVSSYAGYTPIPALGAYSVSKTALISLTKVLGTELGRKGVRVNCVAPGVIKTKFSEALWKGKSVKAEANEPAQSHESSMDIPIGRFGEPDEVAALACFLCSDDASYITGETVVVAGGAQSRL